MVRPHSLFWYYDSKKWLLILLLPVLRTLFSRQDAVAVIVSSLRDIAVAGALIAYSAFKWQQARYGLHDGLMVDCGLLLHRRLRVMADDAASVEVERSPLMWLTGGRRVRINTAGLRRRADATIYVIAEDARRLVATDAKEVSKRYASRVLPVLVLSASSSNAALGLLTLAPLLRQAGQLLGREVTGEVYGLFNRIVSFGLPPLLDGIAHVFVLGWFYAFLHTFARTAGFTTRRIDDRLHVLSGLLTRRDTYIDTSRITSVELRQTLFMRLFGLHSVTISAAGYGREKGARPVIIPAAKPRELCAALNLLLPDYPTCGGSLRPVRGALPGYTWMPLLLTLGSLVPLYYGGVWSMLAAVWFLIGVWWLMIRLTGFLRAGFGVNDHAVTLRTARGLALYEIHIPREVADCLLIYQNPLQKRGRTCTVELRCFGEKRRRHRVSGLPYTEVCRLAEQLVHPKIPI